MSSDSNLFADHFSSQAETYARHRPHYPDALFDWPAEQTEARELAWDAGCGNGQASLGLARRFGRVYASDPSAAQIEQCPVAPNIEFVQEAAESCSLSADSVDLILVAQAYHWFDHPRFLATVERVAKPGAVFCTVSYGLCQVDPEVDAVFMHLYDEVLGAYWPAERVHVENGYRDLPMPGRAIDDPPAFSMRPTWDLASYLGYLASWSATQRYKQATSDDPIKQTEALFRRAWGAAERARPVEFPLSISLRRL